MRAIERVWKRSAEWSRLDKVQLTEQKMWAAFWDEMRQPPSPTNYDCLPLTVRYDNGQLCTFRRRSPAPINQQPEDV